MKDMNVTVKLCNCALKCIAMVAPPLAVSVMRTQSFHYHRLSSHPGDDEDENDEGQLEDLDTDLFECIVDERKVYN